MFLNGLITPLKNIGLSLRVSKYGDGGSRTHVQKYRHLNIYERSHRISISHKHRPGNRLPFS